MTDDCTLTQDERCARWRQMEQECRGIIDALDQPIDPGILELVVALNGIVQGFVQKRAIWGKPVEG